MRIAVVIGADQYIFWDQVVLFFQIGNIFVVTGHTGIADIGDLSAAEDVAAVRISKNNYRFSFHFVVILKAEPDAYLRQQSTDELQIGFFPLNDHFPTWITVAQLVKIDVVAFKIPAVFHQLCDEFWNRHIHVHGRTIVSVQQCQLMFQHTLIQPFIA